MVTRVVLIAARPTPWDTELRLVGSRPLPLTAEAIDSIRHLLQTLPYPITSVYRPAANEACDQAARLVAQHFHLRVRDNAGLENIHLGLWEGLTPEEIRFRFPTVFPEWEANPLAVVPPDGEPLAGAIKRISGAVTQILRRNRGECVGLALRPMAFQIASGVLMGESPQTMAGHLHQDVSIATIEPSLTDQK